MKLELSMAMVADEPTSTAPKFATTSFPSPVLIPVAATLAAVVPSESAEPKIFTEALVAFAVAVASALIMPSLRTT